MSLREKKYPEDHFRKQWNAPDGVDWGFKMNKVTVILLNELFCLCSNNGRDFRALDMKWNVI